MTVNAKGIAILVIAFAMAVAIAYSVGTKESGQVSDADSGQAKPMASAQSANAVQKNQAAGTTKSKDLFANVGKKEPVQPRSNKRFTHFRVGNRNVKGMQADGESVWVGTSGGIIRYNIKTEDYKLYDVQNGSLISNGVFHVSKLRGNIMVGTYGGGVSAYDAKTDSWKNYNIPDGLADQFVYDIAEDPEGNVWIATWSGANFVKGGDLGNKANWKTYSVENTSGGLPNDWVYGVEIGLNGDVWFASEGGLARRDKQGKWTNWQHKDGLGAPYEKVKKDIMFTNDPAKTSRHHATQKAQQGLKDVQVGYNPNYIVSMVVTADGVVWCGTWGGGLSSFDGKTWTTYTVQEGLPGNHVFMLSKSHTGKLWIGTNKGLASIDPGKAVDFKTLTMADGLYADNVFSLTEASDGSLWVGGFGGVARLQDGG